jgi:predicted nicotinamide N-methyase
MKRPGWEAVSPPDRAELFLGYGARVNRAALITQHSVIRACPLVPELPLRLITEDCDLWRATEADAAALGLPLPYWAFAWPGGQALARTILDSPALVSGRRVLDFGSGGAIEGLAAARVGAKDVLCADIDPFAGVAAELNAKLNGLKLRTTEADLIGNAGEWEVILAGDVLYERALTDRVLDWLRSEAARGVRVLLGDPHRGFLDPSGLERVAEYLCAADGDLSGTQLKATAVWQVIPSGSRSGR